MEPPIIKLIAVESKGAYKLRLRFSDGAWGVYDFSRDVEASTPMTEPLRDTEFFGRHFIELGALAWPNGFDLSAEALHRQLKAAGELRRDSKVA
ncbi:MAG TPA: DUF2442 domain-containing protein [Dokdonella sp.]|uniref:DUF2442 domain-containing protein n=1 Tax=Dokdonella sp. TaxID=2291710 RepID=UPI002D7F5EF9|nr:DUF2442 domain-containing protein [Dokdonella sp.]HET9032747.1 DUF2442 domain-containing protein [Dokdonella sp.]